MQCELFLAEPSKPSSKPAPKATPQALSCSPPDLERPGSPHSTPFASARSASSSSPTGRRSCAKRSTPSAGSAPTPPSAFTPAPTKTPPPTCSFASIQTLGKAAHLRNFGSKRFDYIVVDEFHHAAARTYRRLIDYFEPEFLLGLTATPERTDGGDLLALCGENLVYRCDLLEGIEREHLVPFRYIGVCDEVDYQNGTVKFSG